MTPYPYGAAHRAGESIVSEPAHKLIYRGQVLVYFNRHADAPRVWCISDKDRAWELQVQSVHKEGARFVTVYLPLVPSQQDHDGPPSAYDQSEGEVTVEVTGGRAVIRP